MSSSCSSVDLGIDPDFDDLVTDSLLNDIEIFAEHTNRLRTALDHSTHVPEGESKCVQVHAALSMVSQSVRDLLVRYPIFKTSQVLIPASQLVHSIKGLNFDGAYFDSTRTLACIDKLEAAVGNTLKYSVNGRNLSESPPTKHQTGTVGRKFQNQVTPKIYDNRTTLANGINNTVTGASSLAYRIGVGRTPSRPLLRRHSAFQPRPPPGETECDMDQLLIQAAKEDALDVAFARSKLWSKYCEIIITFYKERLLLENEHAQKMLKLTEQTRKALGSDLNLKSHASSLPMMDVFSNILSTTDDFCHHMETTTKQLNDDVVKQLHHCHVDHENMRRHMKVEYNKHQKALSQCNADLKKAQRTMDAVHSNYVKARDVTNRSQQAVSTYTVNGGTEHHRKMKDVEKKKRNEEDALQKKNDAESQMKQLSVKRDAMLRKLGELETKNVTQLCHEIIGCDRATKTGTVRFLETFGSLWTSYPAKYATLADAANHYQPGSEFMSFLQNLPGRSVSSSSLLRHDCPVTEDEAGGSSIHGGIGIGIGTATTSLGGRSSTTSSASAIARQRRNALNEIEHYGLIINTQHHRKPKRSVGRLFDQSSSTVEYTEPTKSHKLVRTRQVIKCVHCDRVSLLSETVKCSTCGLSWHKKCLPHNAVACGPNAKPFVDSSRRVSIFGVPLKSHLELQKCKVPIIIEKCVDEIQRHGMTCKGIYRICGVKSKVEQTCQAFEQSDDADDVNLDDVHPTNVASVIKLYLRKLPEPLLSFELYQAFLDFDIDEDSKVVITELQDLFATKLPEQNYDTLKFLMLHLKRVTWFHAKNLMTASNLAAVITPSLIWPPSAHLDMTPASAMPPTSASTSSFVMDAHKQSRVVEQLIKNAYEIFEVDSRVDWKEFFERYSDVTEPPITTETPSAADGSVDGLYGQEEEDLGEDDEDDLEDDYEGEEDLEATTPCSSSNVSQQPPTPDLLRNMDNNNRPASRSLQSSADNILTSCSSTQTHHYLPATRTASAGTAASTNSSTDVGRTYTTSILVSPTSARKDFATRKQASLEKRYPSSMASANESPVSEQPPTPRPQTLRSGEVTIDMKQNQFFLPSPLLDTRPPTGRDRMYSAGSATRLPRPPSVTITPDTSTSSAGSSSKPPVIFSAGSDTSYV